MSINTLQSTSPIDQLARSLVERFDANRDGQLTTDEFTSFLSNFMNAVGAPASTAPGIAAGAPAVGLRKGLVPGGGAAALEGFNADKIADASHLTTKYRFARVAQQYTLDGVTSKAAAETLLNSMKGDLAAAGLDVLAIKNDKIKLTVEGGKEAWIDVMRAVGSGQAKAWQWLKA